MYFSSLASASIGALALTSLVSAIPLDRRTIAYGNRGDHAAAYAASQSGAPTSSYAPTQSGQYYPPPSSSATPAQSGTPPPPPAPQGSAGAVTFPLANGFPNIQNPSQALTDIEVQAHGILPNGPPPPVAPQPDDLTSLRLIAFNELFEVFYFTELLNNVTLNLPGYQFQDAHLRQQVIDALTAVVAQEELHALNANSALSHFNAGPIQPCKYKSPVSDFKSAIGLAATFTDVVLGTLGDVATLAAKNGDAGLIRGFAAVIGQEGEQDGFYRSLLGKVPSALPFLTASAREFAFSALNQNFVVPGSCPNSNTIALPIFGALNVLTQNIAAQDQTLQFSFHGNGTVTSANGLSLVYINQQNVPVVEPISGATVAGDGTITFSAQFPFSKTIMNGLTIAAVVKGQGPFADVDAVAKATLFGPGLIEVN